MNNKSKKAVTKTELSAAEVIEWLSDHPHFFDTHREVLSKMDLPSDAGTAVSLHQYQVRIMREEKREMDNKLALLVKNAKINHKINEDLLGLATKLIALSKPTKSTAPKLATITEHFGLQLSHLVSLTDQPVILELHSVLSENKPVCENKMDKATLTTLFGGPAKGVESYAIIPLCKAGVLDSVLVLGADDADRFKPGMGTEFLKQLGRLIQEAV
ncbi:MAG: hypothetical protein ACI9J2_000788 [Saprospiraceae bacterium]|jgi:uncharacterized protein YigA (DUF484 family)